MILSASDVGGFPPPMTRWSRLYAGGQAQLLRGDRDLIVPEVLVVCRPALSHSLRHRSHGAQLSTGADFDSRMSRRATVVPVQ